VTFSETHCQIVKNFPRVGNKLCYIVEIKGLATEHKHLGNRVAQKFSLKLYIPIFGHFCELSCI